MEGKENIEITSIVCVSSLSKLTTNAATSCISTISIIRSRQSKHEIYLHTKEIHRVWYPKHWTRTVGRI